MKLKQIPYILVYLLVGCSVQGHVSDRQQSERVHVVLLAGQSNMEGAGNYESLDQRTKQRINDVSSRVMLSVRGKPAVPLSYTLSPHKLEKYGFDQAFGPEMLMGLTLAETFPKRKFLLIKTAYGGTSLYGAWSHNWTHEKASKAERGYKKELPLYKTFHNNITEQLHPLNVQEIPYRIVGMAWMQGENDAAKEFAALSYKENLINFIKQNRVDVDVKNMPFIIGQINSTYGKFKKGPEVVRKAMEDIATTMPNTSLIETTTDTRWPKFPKHKDNTHYNTEGQKRLGKAFANKLIPYIN